jgi:hypothetical protein
MPDRLPFKAQWVLDFESCQPDGGLPDPLCLVAIDLVSGTRIERWLPRSDPGQCPYDTGPDSVFIGHNFAAEALCQRVLEWPAPTYVLDTFVEIRARFNGKPYQRAGLLEAAARLGIPTIRSADKEAGREIAIRGRAYAEQHKAELIEYCGSDVATNADLFKALLPQILSREMGLAHSLIFGSFMVATAAVEHVGVPIDGDLLARLQHHWAAIKRLLIDRFDRGQTDCYVDYRFNRKRFSHLLASLGMLDAWPKSEAMGWPTTEEDVFKERARGHPVLWPLFELHYTLEHMKQLTLHVGPDGRHRAVGQLGTGNQKRSAGLYPFGTKTGRCAPRGFIFAPAVWVRFLIRPEPGTALIYFDYKSQEIHIAARKSGDPNLIKAIEADDAYMWFARQNGMAPPDATKQSHKTMRDSLLKPFFLGVNYGSKAQGIAGRLGVTVEYAEHVLLAGHERLFPTYWRYVNAFLDTATCKDVVHTAFGWPLHITADVQLRSLQNHPIQSAGADILRIAVIGLVAQGVRVCCPVHDALLVECQEDEIDRHLELVPSIMREASAAVLGHEIPVDANVIRSGEHYYDDRGASMYNRVMKLLAELESFPPDVEPDAVPNTRTGVLHRSPRYPALHWSSIKNLEIKCFNPIPPWSAPRWLAEPSSRT